MKDYVMATRGVSQPEAALIDKMQKNFENAKKALEKIERDAQKIYALNKDNNEPEVAAEAFRVKAAVAVARGYTEQAHSAGTDALLRCFDDGGPIVFGGGGR